MQILVFIQTDSVKECGTSKKDALPKFWKVSDDEPVSQGFRLPPVISPSRGQIPRDLALPARPPLGISPPPPPNDTVQRIFLYLDLATQKASEIWFGNLFDNGFAWVRLGANVVWYFQKLELTS